MHRCTILVYIGVMPASKRKSAKPIKAVRRSVSLPAEVEKQVHTMAKRHRLSENRMLIELIEQGIEARNQKEKNFFAVAERFRAATEPEEVKQLGDQLGRMVFGE